MSKRRIAMIGGKGVHVNPIPDAVRIANTITSGAIPGVDPKTGKAPDDFEAQARLVFAHVKELVEALDGTMDDVLKMNVKLKALGDRAILNKIWLATFPDENDRPARHTVEGAMTGNYLIQIEFTAVLGA
jgi:2-iminobutanoate/2-iminopropanoate deaminase